MPPLDPKSEEGKALIQRAYENAKKVYNLSDGDDTLTGDSDQDLSGSEESIETPKGIDYGAATSGTPSGSVTSLQPSSQESPSVVAETSAKKSSSASKKATKSAIKSEDGQDVNAEHTAVTVKAESPLAADDKGKGKAAGKANVTKKRKLSDDGGNVDKATAGPSSAPKRQKGNPRGPPKGRRVSTKYEDATPEDKMLWDERQAGTSWNEVRAKWEQITGEKVGGSTLPNRLDRLKVHFSKLKAEDEPTFMSVLGDMDRQYQAEKWGRISEVLHTQHQTIKYPAKALEKGYQEIFRRGGVQIFPAPGKAGVVPKTTWTSINDGKDEV